MPTHRILIRSISLQWASLNQALCDNGPFHIRLDHGTKFTKVKHALNYSDTYGLVATALSNVIPPQCDLLRCLLTPREFLGIGGPFIRETLKMSVKTDWHQASREGLTEPLSYSPHTSVGQTASDLRDETWSCGLVF